MPASRVVLTDVDQGVWQDHWSLNATTGPKLAGSSNWSLSKRTLRGGFSDGVDVVDINNGELSMSLIPTRGLGLWRGSYRGLPIEWKSPVARLVHPKFVNPLERGSLGWLNGFNELMCRCGLSFNGPPGDDNGTPITLHGRIANLPAHQVVAEICDAGAGTLSVTGSVDEASLFGPALRLTSKLSTKAGSNALLIEDTVTNLGGQPTELELLYHTNIGRPFLEAGSRLHAAVGEVAPRDAHSANGADRLFTYAAPTAGIREEAFFFELLGDANHRTRVMLANAAGTCGFGMRFSTSELPCFTLWKNPQAEADGYVTGLEPGTNYPNFRKFERERGRVISLAPGASYSAAFELAIFDTAAAVSEEAQSIAALQTRAAVQHPQPIAKYSTVHPA